MKTFSTKITLNKNNRGVYIIDPLVGCSGGMKTERGCFNDCYAYRAAKLYGFDFSKDVKRDFIDKKHEQEIRHKIKKAKTEFIRMGNMGDPSNDWEHTIRIIKKIDQLQKEYQFNLFNYSNQKPIVIITKHWHNLTDEQINSIKGINIIFNSSVSAVDKICEIHNRVNQYKRLKQFGFRSYLRVVTMRFTDKGKGFNNIQSYLLKQGNIIDTVFRPTKNNPLITDGFIEVKQGSFLGKKTLLSKLNPKTYTGNCINCLEKCGLSM